MGLEFKLSDRELPVSPVFVNFLAQALRAPPPLEQEIWPEQRSECLSSTELDADGVAAAARLVIGNASGRERLTRAYTLLFSLLTGDLAPLQELQSRYHFVTIVGIPRTGGSYLTAELYRALGFTPAQVPHGLAHDSFPEAAPFQLKAGTNGWLVTLKTMAEYLTMVETFFADRKPHAGKLVVPKKLTKAAYAGGFFCQVLGESTEHVLTLRHPVASCISTYDKSGGLPLDGRFKVRSNIEEWCRRDLESLGCRAQELAAMDYFDAYLQYWEHYHLSVALTGLSASRHLKVVVFGKPALESAAQAYHDRYGSQVRASDFHTSANARERHPEWIHRATPVIDRVASTWKSAGLEFPVDDIHRCW
jgi:hypothetical protein